jgi:hypothetical protein
MKNKEIYLFLSLLLSSLIILTALVGLTEPAIYAQETANWRVQAIAQDIFDGLILAPVIMVSALLIFKGRLRAYPVWVGSLFYSIYTYSIYAFTINFGLLFPVYLLILGLSFYLLMFSLISQRIKLFKKMFESHWIKNILAIALIFFGSFFYLVWGSEVFRALSSDTIPSSVRETGLITNPVHVLDMAFLLPAMIISGVLLKRRNKFGYLFAPAVLTTKTLFTLTIIMINLEFKRHGLEADQSVILMFSLILGFDLFILGQYLAQIKESKNGLISLLKTNVLKKHS